MSQMFKYNKRINLCQSMDNFDDVHKFYEEQDSPKLTKEEISENSNNPTYDK